MSSAELELLEENKEENECLEEDDCLEKKVVKEKKPRSQKQIDAFEKVRALRDIKRGERKEVRIKDAEVRTKIVEEKVIKKAIFLKKKQILQDAHLDDIDEEIEAIPVAVVKKIMTKYKPKPSPVPISEPPPPLPTFSFI